MVVDIPTLLARYFPQKVDSWIKAKTRKVIEFLKGSFRAAAIIDKGREKGRTDDDIICAVRDSETRNIIRSYLNRGEIKLLDLLKEVCPTKSYKELIAVKTDLLNALNSMMVIKMMENAGMRVNKEDIERMTEAMTPEVCIFIRTLLKEETYSNAA